MSPASRTLLALVAGLLLGLLGSSLGDQWADRLTTLADTVGQMWIRGILMTALPLVAVSVALSILSTVQTQLFGSMGLRAASTCVPLLIASSVLTALLVPMLFDSMNLGSVSLPKPAQHVSLEQMPGMQAWFVSLIPRNPFSAAAGGELLPLLTFTLAFSIAASRTAPAHQATLRGALAAVNETLLVLVRWIIAIAPFGVFALSFSLTARAGLSLLGVLGVYLAAVGAVCIFAIAVLYLLVAATRRVTLGEFARACAPAQAVAFSSRSSLAALPAMLEGATRHLRRDEAQSRLLLPLLVALFKYSGPLFQLLVICFVGQLYASPLDTSQVLALVPAAIVFSFGTPGVPGGTFSISAALFALAGLPAEAIALLLAVDALPDGLRTTANVTANLAITALVCGPAPTIREQGLEAQLGP